MKATGRYLPDHRRYYISFGFYSFSNGLFSIFINVLYFSTENISMVIYYQISVQITQILLFLVTTYLLKYINARFLYFIGSVMKAFIISTLFIFPVVQSNAIIFGLLYGISSGIFWAGNSTFTLEISRAVRRFNFLSANTAISNFASLIAPLIGGVIISFSLASGVERYLNDFLLSSILLILTGISSLFIHSKGEKGGNFRIKNIRIQEDGYSKFRMYFFFSSILSMVMSVLIPIYVYYITKNFVITGLYGSITGFIGFASGISAPFLNAKLSKNYIIAIFTVMATAFLFLDSFNSTRRFWINREYYLLVGRVLPLASILILINFFTLPFTVMVMPVFSLSMLGYIPVLKSGEEAVD